MAKLIVSPADVRTCLATLDAVAAIVREKPRPRLPHVQEGEKETQDRLLRDQVIGPLGFTAFDVRLSHQIRIARIEAAEGGIDIYVSIVDDDESWPHRLRFVCDSGTWKIAVFQSQCAACFALDEFKPCMLCLDGWLPEQSDHELSVRG